MKIKDKDKIKNLLLKFGIPEKEIDRELDDIAEIEVE